MMYPGRIKAGVQFSIADEVAMRAPAEYIRRYAAEKAGDLLTELLLNPEADPYTDLQLRAQRLVVDDFRLQAATFRVELSCATMPKQYTPIAGGQTYDPVASTPPGYLADAPLWAPKELE